MKVYKHTHTRARIKYIFKKIISQFYICEKVKKIHERIAKVIKIVQELKIIFNCDKSFRKSFNFSAAFKFYRLEDYSYRQFVGGVAKKKISKSCDSFQQMRNTGIIKIRSLSRVLEGLERRGRAEGEGNISLCAIIFVRSING